MSLDYLFSFEKYGLAYDELMTIGDHHKTRLRRALFHIGRVRERDVPEALHKEFNNIDKRIRNGIPVQTILDRISDEDVNKLIDDIIDFNQRLIWWCQSNS